MADVQIGPFRITEKWQNIIAWIGVPLTAAGILTAIQVATGAW